MDNYWVGGLLSNVVRFLLALLAVLGLLVSPLTAAAAEVACDQTAAMAEMAMPMMAGMDQGAAKATAQPCCDPSGKSKTNTMNCAQACAAMCGVAIVPSDTMAIFAPIATSVVASHAKPTALAPFEPGQLKRPPRSIL